MFDFSKYRKYNQFDGVRLHLNLPPGKEERKAILEYLEIDKQLLIKYLKSIINECLNNRELKAKNSYKRRMDKIKKLPRKYQNQEVKEFEIKILRRYQSDNSVYKKVFENNASFHNIDDLIIKETMNRIHDLPSYIGKLLYITDYKSKLEQSMLNITLQQIITQPEISFEDIFHNKEDFKNIINLLISKKVIINNSNGYSWEGMKNESNLKNKKLICTLGYVLYEKGYFKITEDSSIVKGLNNLINKVKF